LYKKKNNNKKASYNEKNELNILEVHWSQRKLIISNAPELLHFKKYLENTRWYVPCPLSMRSAFDQMRITITFYTRH